MIIDGFAVISRPNHWENSSKKACFIIIIILLFIGAWHTAMNVSVEKYILISWFFSFLEVKVAY